MTDFSEMIIIIEIAGESKNLCKHKLQTELRQAAEEAQEEEMGKKSKRKEKKSKRKAKESKPFERAVMKNRI